MITIKADKKKDVIATQLSHLLSPFLWRIPLSLHFSLHFVNYLSSLTQFTSLSFPHFPFPPLPYPGRRSKLLCKIGHGPSRGKMRG